MRPFSNAATNSMDEPETSPFWAQVTTTKLVRYLLLFALGWVIVQVLAYFETVLLIFVFAAILAFLLNYPIRWLARFIPRSLAVIVVFLLAILILAGLVATLGLAIVSQAQQLITQAPASLNVAIAWIESLQRLLTQWNINADFSGLEEQLRNEVLAGIGIGFATLQNVLINVVDLVLIAVVAFFMLLDGKRLWDFALKPVPQDFRHSLTTIIQQNFLGFFWGRLLLSIFFGISAFLVFIVLGVPYALVLAAIAGVFDLIPGIGATLGISLISIIVLPQGILTSLKVLVGCILLQQVEENLLMPRIMQGSINMNPVVMFFALLVGARVAGLVGVFLSIPITGVLISLFSVDEMRGEEVD